MIEKQEKFSRLFVRPVDSTAVFRRRRQKFPHGKFNYLSRLGRKVNKCWNFSTTETVEQMFDLYIVIVIHAYAVPQINDNIGLVEK